MRLYGLKFQSWVKIIFRKKILLFFHVELRAISICTNVLIMNQTNKNEKLKYLVMIEFPLKKKTSFRTV